MRILFCFLQSALSCLALYALFLLRPFLSFSVCPDSQKNEEDSRFPAVVFVHPALQNAASWFFYRRAFLKAGFTRLYFFEYSCREPSLERVGCRLRQFLDKVGQDKPNRETVIIGASLGGLVSRAALSTGTKVITIQRLITLACPHQGSRLAALIPKAIFPLLGSITYRSPDIVVLEQKERKGSWEDIGKTAFFSTLDELVRPAEALLPPVGMDWKEVRTGQLGHMSIMLHKPTIRAVLHELLPGRAVGA